MNKKEYPGTVAAVHGAEEPKADENLSVQNTPHPAQSQPAAVQRARILEHLKRDTLTTLQARALGIMHPGVRVCELRKHGHQIVTQWATEYCAGGVCHRVARYRLDQRQECL